MHPIADLQIEYSLLSRGIEDGILQTCRELGIGITAYGVLSRGLIGGDRETGGAGDFRAHSPRFQGDNLVHNNELVARLQPIAAKHGITLAQLAIAWVVAQGRDVLPIVGMSKRSRIAEALQASTTSLGAADLAEIDVVVPAGSAAGDRYPTALMAQLDSETSN